MNLPQVYKNRIIDIMGKEAQNYFKLLDFAPFAGIRVNLIKTQKEKIAKILNLNNLSPFCDYLFYADKNEVSGNHPLHHAGAFYFQEPSASSVVTALNPKTGDYVLDVCAAPGGKSTQIASLIGNSGLIWSNEFVSSRVQKLISNIERMGISNAVVSSVRPDILADKLNGFFDKVLVDAPCSGEGMIRKDPSILSSWSLENVISCSNRQLKILESAALCVKDGGYLCYSTCTFSPEENEMIIGNFLQNHPEFSMHKIEKPFGTNGLKKYAEATENIEYSRRILPCHGGEGHFVALMKKQGISKKQSYSEKPENNQMLKVFDEFYKDNFKAMYSGIAINFGNKVYIKPNVPNFSNIGIIRMGLYCGEVIKNRFVPSHALFATPNVIPKREINLDLNNEDLLRFLHGEEINCNETLKGYTAVKAEGIPLGFGKASNGKLKNHYPKGLRI